MAFRIFDSRHGRSLALFAASLALIVAPGCGTRQAQRPTPTFTRDIAPIVFNHCTVCHRPEGSAPFRLLTYDEVRDRASQIAQVTKSRFMPPWLAEPGEFRFSGDCRLSDAQITTIQDWLSGGAVEGNPADLPPPPHWPMLGEPDLLVTMPTSYTLSGEGTDVWRKFVISVPLKSPRYVRAVVIRPNNKRIIHHAIVHIDPSGEARALAAKSPDGTIDGMITTPSERSPAGHFLNWLPGMTPFADDPEMACASSPAPIWWSKPTCFPAASPSKFASASASILPTNCRANIRSIFCCIATRSTFRPARAISKRPIRTSCRKM